MQQQKPVFVVGGTSSGVGKTSIAVGLMASLRERGLTVQAFKVGPDFIDPMHHERATGRPSINLDGWMMTKDQVLGAYQRHMADADVAVVEGVMGLFDGRDGATEAGSTAEIAKWLGAPVLLVLDCSAIARSAAAVVKGYQEFDPALNLAALLFNKVGGAAHTEWLSDAMTSAGLGLRVIGGIPKDDTVAIRERYLGLHMPHDPTMPINLIAGLAALVQAHVDLDAVMEVASTATTPLSIENNNTDDRREERDASIEVSVAGREEPPPEPASLGKPAVRSDTANAEGEGDAVVENSGATAASMRPVSAGSNGSGGGAGGTKKKRKSKKDNAAAAAKQSTAAVLATPPQRAAEQPETASIAQPSEETSDVAPPAAAAAAAAHQQEDRSPFSYLHLPIPGPCVRIAVARDAAFCFYYHDNLALLADAGAEIVPFSPLNDPLPLDIAGVYLGGGYPEHHAAELADNKLFRAGMKAFVDAGGVVYAECGGLLVLSQSIQPRGEPAQPMVGVFPFKTVLPPGKYTMGYVEIEATSECPLFPPGIKARGHVHHASELVEEHHVGGVVVQQGGGAGGGDANGSSGGGGGSHVGAAWRNGYITRPQIPGAPETPEGFTCGRVLASYVHLHFGGCPELATSLVERCRKVDVEATTRAVAASAAEAGLLEGSCVQATPPSSVIFNTVPSGLLAVRSSPDFHRPGGIRSRSVDLSRHPGMHPLNLNGGPLTKMHSPATTLNKVVSSGSLSTHSAQFYPASYNSGSNLNGGAGGQQHGEQYPWYPMAHHAVHAAALHHAEHRSQRSESPLQLSPRTGSDLGYPQHAMHASDLLLHPGDVYAPYPPPLNTANVMYLHSNPLAHQNQQQQGHSLHQLVAPRSSMQGQHPPPNSIHNNMNGYTGSQQQQQQHQPGYIPLSAGASDDGLDPRSAYMARSASYTHLPSGSAASLPHPWPQHALHANHVGGSMEDPSNVDATPPNLGGGSKVGRLTPGSLDLSSLSRKDPNFGEVSSGGRNCATPHNWQNSFPPSDKIVTLGAGATEIAWALGLGNRVVAVSDTCDYPPEAAGKAKAARRLPASLPLPSNSSSVVTSTSQSPTKTVSGNMLSGNGGSTGALLGPGTLPPGTSATGSATNLAALAAATAAAAAARDAPLNTLPWRVDDQVLARERPGLIFYEDDEAPPAGSSSGTKRASGSLVGVLSDALASVGLQHACRVVCLRRSTLGDVLNSMFAVGEAAGVADEALRSVDRLRARLRRVAGEAARVTAVSATESRPRCLVLRSLQPLVAAGLWAPDMVTLAGGESGPMQAGDASRTLSWEEVLAFAPEVLVIAGLVDGNGTRTFRELSVAAALPGWWSLPAVRSGLVFVCEDVLLLRPGPRLVEGTESLARMMHGDAVSVCCPPRAVLKLSLRPGQRCRPRLLPNYFMAYC